ncbi:hypothetical protein CCZ20_27350 [Priestia aryabhattai]|uniref:hypothetical protein n=1 Tax=Priestia aryabhattai TaxID=412384 RepID=UPI000B504A07|nr:hypothetical protein [Priestia aryabhattai]OVE34286.1 hypothetical protein CCZ20_27350 [Priestia aryabhattai]
MKNDTNSLIHLPDLLFVQCCEEEFGINRGVYNTIELWFYKKGVEEVTQRRKYALNFFLSLNPYRDKKIKIKFGHGGLVTRLEHYWKVSTQTQLKQNA